MYNDAVEDRRGTFTPFVLSVDGLLHKEASHFIKHLATSLSLPSGTKPTPSPAATSDHGSPLQGFEQ